MSIELITALVMIIISLAGSFLTKKNRKWAAVFLFVAAVAGSLVSGMGIRFREIVEGPFAFLDCALSVCSATLFVFLLAKTGAFERLFRAISGIQNKTLKSFALMFFIALPAMFTGFASASVLTTGKIVSKALKEDKKSKTIVALASFLGMILPPNCIPAMIAANGAGSVLPTPYVGFFLPLLLLALPAFVVVTLTNKAVLSSVPKKTEKETEENKVSLTVLLVVFLAVLVESLLSSYVYIGGNTLAFFLASLVIIGFNLKSWGLKNTLNTVSESIMPCIGPVAWMLALGSFIEVTSMTGFRGLFSLWILPFDVPAVMLVLMAISLVVGFFAGSSIPAFLCAYAVFPIGWLANTVIVTGVSSVLSLVILWEMLHQDEFSIGYEKKSICLPAILVLAVGIVFVLLGDKLSFLIL